jgi:hypothetical protein
MVPSLLGNQTALTTIDLAGNPATNIRAARCLDVDAGTDAATKLEESSRKSLRVEPPPGAANSRVPNHPSEADRSVAHPPPPPAPGRLVTSRLITWRAWKQRQHKGQNSTSAIHIDFRPGGTEDSSEGKHGHEELRQPRPMGLL